MHLIQLKQIAGLDAQAQENAGIVVRGYQVLYQTGDQTAAGEKTFTERLRAGGGLYVGEGDLAFNNFISSGHGLFSKNLRVADNTYLSGQLWVTGLKGANFDPGNAVLVDQDRWYNLDQPYLVYNTGTQQILGSKVFNTSITGNQDLLISGAAYISGGLWCTGYSQPRTPLQVQPMISGDALVLPPELLQYGDPAFNGQLYKYASGTSDFLMISRGP
jgi:hypothetical protein